METTREERDQYHDAIGTAYDEDGSPHNEFLLRLIRDADLAEELLEALEELHGLMQGVIEGDYMPDSFTLQVAEAAIAKARGAIDE